MKGCRVKLRSVSQSLKELSCSQAKVLVHLQVVPACSSWEKALLGHFPVPAAQHPHA